MAARKFVKLVAGKHEEESAVVTSAGAASEGAIPALDANGKLDSTLMPAGLGADSQAMVASETIANGDFVNIWSDAGAFKIRKADATNQAKEAHGYVLVGGAATATLTMFFDDPNTAVTGQVPGDVYLSATVPGKSTATIPTASGNIVQRVGVAVSATNVHVAIGVSTKLA